MEKQEKRKSEKLSFKQEKKFEREKWGIMKIFKLKISENVFSPSPPPPSLLSSFPFSNVYKGIQELQIRKLFLAIYWNVMNVGG